MKKPVIITLLLVLSSLLTKAQDTTKFRAQPDSVIKVVPVEVGRHIAYLYSIGGKIQTPDDVKIKLLSYAPAAAEYNMAKNNLTWSYVSYGGFGVSTIVATILYATHNKHAGETTGIVNGQASFIYQPHSLTGAYVITGVAIGFLTSAIINFVHAHRHSERAMNLYNRRFE